MGRRGRTGIDSYDKEPLDSVPDRHRGAVEEITDSIGDEDTTLIKQTGNRGGGAKGNQRANLELHFHIGDVDESETNIEFNVGDDVDEEELEEAKSLFEKLLGGTGGDDE